MNQEDLKERAARAALDHLVEGAVVGVGSGSTVNHFIRALGDIRHRVAGAVSSSEKSSSLLREVGIEVIGLDALDWTTCADPCRPISVYVDGADEIDDRLRMIKGGGGALTREKIVAAASMRFVCIADASKWVQRLGAFPLPIEVIPMARALIERQIRALGGEPRLREGFVTDNGHLIVDVHGLVIEDPVGLEAQLNQWPGVVTVGLFARRGADVALIAQPSGQVAVCLP